MRPAKIQISLRIRAVWSESSLGTFWIARDAKFLHSDNEDSEQTARIHRMICVFVMRICEKVRFLPLRLIYLAANQSTVLPPVLWHLQTGQPLESRDTHSAVQSFVNTGQPFRFCDAPALVWPDDTDPDKDDAEELLLPERSYFTFLYIKPFVHSNGTFILSVFDTLCTLKIKYFHSSVFAVLPRSSTVTAKCKRFSAQCTWWAYTDHQNVIVVIRTTDHVIEMLCYVTNN